MVFLTISKKITSVVGPVLLKTGLNVRNAISYVLPGGSKTSRTSSALRDNPYLDMMLMIPYAQKLISLAIYEKSAEVVTQYNDQQREKMQEKSSSLDQMYDSLFGQQQKQQQQYSKKSISELRVKVFEEKIRPSLLPNESWSDVMKWRFNVRVIKWARTEFLISKYGPAIREALDAYPQIRSSPQLSKHPTQRMLMNLARGRPLNSSSNSSYNTSSTTNNNKEKQ